MKSIQPGKQRKNMYNAPLHKKRKSMSAHLEENLLLKYDKRSMSIVKGDTVKVMRGSFKGHEDKVANVNIKKRTLEIEGITMSKADGNKIAKPVNHSNVLITKLNLTDKWRRKKLERGLSEEVKKEIEKEAEEQIKEVEEEQKKIEEEKKLAEAEEEITEEEPSEEKEEKPEVKSAKPKTTAAKKTTEAKKPAEKKETQKKKIETTKKTPAKKKTTTMKKKTTSTKKEEK